MKRTDSEAPYGASKKRRRILKYLCIGEDWGEPDVNPPSGEQHNTLTTSPFTGSSLSKEPEERGGELNNCSNPEYLDILLQTGSL